MDMQRRNRRWNCWSDRDYKNKLKRGGPRIVVYLWLALIGEHCCRNLSTSDLTRFSLVHFSLFFALKLTPTANVLSGICLNFYKFYWLLLYPLQPKHYLQSWCFKASAKVCCSSGARFFSIFLLIWGKPLWSF